MGASELAAGTAAAGANRPDTDELLLMYRRMVLVRGLEERLGALPAAGRTRGPIHRCDGQEAVGIGATFLLRRDDPARVRERVAYNLQYRKDTQPPQASAGSVFKNPPGDYSGRLIEAAGLKGKQIGKAQLSPRHANFIVNTGGATAADVVALIALARRTVREQFGIELELEVELRGDW